ncbi:class I SAM-dependent methyltransferase [Novipirellula artificiosorum]|uniref:class I SAM-dependent methyltransferase n=1 Tax=Novipirellula artificiosorum TaxID=2528016 RepID=UPI0018CFE202
MRHPVRLPSTKATRCFEDGELDFVFIDGDHSYQSVKADLTAWHPKLRPGGILLGHDYDPERFPGVVNAVEGFANQQQLKPSRHKHSIWHLAPI